VLEGFVTSMRDEVRRRMKIARGIVEQKVEEGCYTD
jgi:hypothetical protein